MLEKLGKSTFFLVLLCQGSQVIYSRFNTSITSLRQQNLEGIYDPHTNALQYPRIMQATHARWEPCTTGCGSPTVGPVDHDGQADLEFPNIPPVLEQNFLIADTYFQGPPASSFGIPGPDGDVLDLGPSGLAAISDSAAAALPVECRIALQSARSEALSWKSFWGGEKRDGARARLRISYNTPL